ncbi:MAG: hypothetical protein ABIH66_06845 [bacterium]
MRKTAVLACVVLIALMAFAGCSKKEGGGGGGYAVYTSAADKFSVEVPDKFKNFETESMLVGDGTYNATLYTSAQDDMVFMITAIHMEVDEEIALEALKKGREGVAKNGETISEGETTIGGKPALNLRYKTEVQDRDVFYDVGFVYINGIQYQILVGSDGEDKLERAEAKHYFETFKGITAEEAAAEVKERIAGAGEYSFEALCAKLVDEMKASAGGSLAEDAANDTLATCMTGADAYKAAPKGKQAIEAFTKNIFTACEGKSADAWVECYGNQAMEASQAAMNAMMH